VGNEAWPMIVLLFVANVI